MSRVANSDPPATARAPRSTRALVDLDGVPAEAAPFLRALQPDLVFLLDDLAAASEEEIAARHMSASADLTVRFLQFLRPCPPEKAVEFLERWQPLTRQVPDERRGKDVLAAQYHWLLDNIAAGEEVLRTVMAHIDDPKTKQAMKSSFDQLLERGFAQGLEEGRAEGREEGHLRGQRELLRRQLAMRFGAISADIDARLAGSSSADLDSWGARILTAGSLAEVFRSA